MASTGAVSERRVLKEFLELVQIDSPVFEEAAMARALEEKLARLGFSVFNDLTGPSTGNLIARLPGPGGGSTIVLNAHMDTVQPGRGIRPVVRDGVVWSSGDTILAADNKASIAAILEGVRVVLDSGASLPKLVLLFTYGEERAHVGAKALDVSSLQADLCYTLDAEGPVGSIVISAPGYYSVRAAFRGRAAHAGVAPEAGVDALVAAARAIARMPLGRIDAETTANIGVIHGGTARNTVAALVELEGEARSRSAARLEAQVQAMTRAMQEEADRVGATLDLQVNPEYRAFTLDPESPVVILARRAIERVGLPAELMATGGGSDANDLNEKELPTAVLGTGMVGAHSLQEHIAVADLVALSRVVVELIRLAAEGPSV